jgi:hypothetical protein
MDRFSVFTWVCPWIYALVHPWLYSWIDLGTYQLI